MESEPGVDEGSELFFVFFEKKYLLMKQWIECIKVIRVKSDTCIWLSDIISDIF